MRNKLFYLAGKCPSLATISFFFFIYFPQYPILSFCILSSTLLRGVELWKKFYFSFSSQVLNSCVKGVKVCIGLTKPGCCHPFPVVTNTLSLFVSSTLPNKRCRSGKSRISRRESKSWTNINTNVNYKKHKAQRESTVGYEKGSILIVSVRTS